MTTSTGVQDDLLTSLTRATDRAIKLRVEKGSQLSVGALFTAVALKGSSQQRRWITETKVTDATTVTIRLHRLVVNEDDKGLKADVEADVMKTFGGLIDNETTEYSIGCATVTLTKEQASKNAASLKRDDSSDLAGKGLVDAWASMLLAPLELDNGWPGERWAIFDGYGLGLGAEIFAQHLIGNWLEGYRVFVAPAFRGSNDPEHFLDHVAVVEDRPMAGDKPDKDEKKAYSDRVWAAFLDATRIVGAHRENNVDVFAGSFENDPGFAGGDQSGSPEESRFLTTRFPLINRFFVERYLRSRPPRETCSEGGQFVLCVGPHWGGAPDIGSCLATKTGRGFLKADGLARRMFNHQLTDPNSYDGIADPELARDLRDLETALLAEFILRPKSSAEGDWIVSVDMPDEYLLQRVGLRSNLVVVWANPSQLHRAYQRVLLEHEAWQRRVGDGKHPLLHPDRNRLDLPGELTGKGASVLEEEIDVPTDLWKQLSGGPVPHWTLSMTARGNESLCPPNGVWTTDYLGGDGTSKTFINAHNNIEGNSPLNDAFAVDAFFDSYRDLANKVVGGLKKLQQAVRSA